jgi:hypothetical protein
MSNRSDDEGEAMIRLFASAAMAALTLPLTAVAQTTPGQINDPSTYHGSMANQAQEQASAAQAAANQQMLQRLDQDYAPTRRRVADARLAAAGPRRSSSCRCSPPPRIR